MKRILFDTNAYQALLNKLPQLKEAVSGSQIIYFSTIVVGELLAGFVTGSQGGENERLLNKFLKKPGVEVHSPNLETTLLYAEIFKSLRMIGKPIPTNDMWIAAQAMETGSVLITFDRHFLDIPGLRVWPELQA